MRLLINYGNQFLKLGFFSFASVDQNILKTYRATDEFCIQLHQQCITFLIVTFFNDSKSFYKKAQFERLLCGHPYEIRAQVNRF